MPLKLFTKSNRKAMNRNWSNQNANPALKTKHFDSIVMSLDNDKDKNGKAADFQINFSERSCELIVN